jgi:hypothetical protein
VSTLFAYVQYQYTALYLLFFQKQPVPVSAPVLSTLPSASYVLSCLLMLPFSRQAFCCIFLSSLSFCRSLLYCPDFMLRSHNLSQLSAACLSQFPSLSAACLYPSSLAFLLNTYLSSLAFLLHAYPSSMTFLLHTYPSSLAFLLLYILRSFRSFLSFLLFIPVR